MRSMKVVPAAFAVSNDCINWPFGKTGNGYGAVYDPKSGKTLGVHVVAYESAYGPLSKGEVVRHTCDNRACFEITHLIKGSQKENVHDAINRGRMKLAPNKLSASIRQAVLESKKHRKEIMKEFNISQSTYYNIRKESDRS